MIDWNGIQDFTLGSMVCAADRTVVRYRLDEDRLSVEVAKPNGQEPARFGAAFVLAGGRFDRASFWMQASTVGDRLIAGDRSHLCLWRPSHLDEPTRVEWQ